MSRPAVRRVGVLFALSALVLAQQATAQPFSLFQHLDASVAGSVTVDGAGVLTWADQSGNGRDAFSVGDGSGMVSFSMDESIWPRGEDPDTQLNSVQISGGPTAIELLDLADSMTLLNQAAPGASGFSVFVVNRQGDDRNTTWNDIIGNTSVVSGGFLMRGNAGNGNFQTSLDNGSVNPTNQGGGGGLFAGRQDAPVVMGMTYNPVTQEVTNAATLDGYSQTFGGRVPLDFSRDLELRLGFTTNMSRFFNGNYGEVRLYDQALTPDDFAAVMTELDEKWTVDLDGRLDMRIDRSNGNVKIISRGEIPIDLVGLSLLSESGSLNVDEWRSITDNFDADSGDMSVDPVNTWLKFAESAGELSEATLGTATIAGGQEIDLGHVWNNRGSQDVVAEFADPVTNTVRGIVINYFNEVPLGLAGDYNDDGIVNAADYTLWRNNLGEPTGTLPNDDMLAGPVDQDHYQLWRDNFGSSLGVGSSAAVPEPGGLSLCVLSLLALVATTSRWKSWGPACVVTLSFLGAISTNSPANAAVTVDRDYLLGENGPNVGSLGSEGASAGAVVGSGNGFGFTFDWAGQLGTNSLIDLSPQGGPVYADVSNSGLARPGTGNNDLGVTFNGSNYLLSVRGDPASGGGLGSPQEAIQPDFADYGNIRGRGFQFWAYPTDDTAGVRQELVNDTFQFGVHITPDNLWGMNWGSQDDNDGLPTYQPDLSLDRVSDVAVTFNEWTHIMHHTNDFSFTGILYVDGIAVAQGGFAVGGGWEQNTEEAQALGGVGLLNLTAGASLDGSEHHFTGTLDNLEMYVFGGPGGVGDDFGAFNLGTDNEFVVQAMAAIPDGDADLDGDVDDDDVTFFAQNWRAAQTITLCCTENPDDFTVPGVPTDIVVGDLNSRRTIADFNYDGVTNFLDWFILRDNHPTPAALSLSAALAAVGAEIPEPGAFLLSIVALTGCLYFCPRRR